MTVKKRGLGRGLEALLVDVSTKGEIPPQQTTPINNRQKNNHLSTNNINADELLPEPVVAQKIGKAMNDREAVTSALIKTIQKENRHLLQEAENLRQLINEFEAMVRHL
jgi:ParB family chromosome partitioning protein